MTLALDGPPASVPLAGGPLERLLHRQRRLNQTTQASAELYTGHRARLTHLVMDALSRTPARSLVVVGAGNCNDLDLELALRAAKIVHLCDLDEEAIAGARARLGAADRPRVSIHGGVDVSGAMAHIARLAHGRFGLEDLVAIATSCLDEPLAGLPAADVIVSPCLLSQLMDAARLHLGEAHHDLPAVARALLLGHVRLLVRALASGGVGLLASDVADSDALPLDELLAAFGPLETLRTVVDIGRAYTGTDPALVAEILSRDEVVAPLVDGVRLEEPWRWQMSLGRSYLVYAMRFARV